jgi:hypothetical protein
MKQTVTRETFHAAFRNLRPDNFTYLGLNELFNYLQELENDTGSEIELDVIAICCDFSEGDAYDIANDYNLDVPDDEDEAQKIVATFLQDKGCFIGETVIGTFVYSVF